MAWPGGALVVRMGGEGDTPARAFFQYVARVPSEPANPYWLVMDAVGFLPAPGRKPLFGSDAELARLDAWLHELMTGEVL